MENEVKMGVESVISTFAQQGLLGAIIIALAIWSLRKDNENKSLREYYEKRLSEKDALMQTNMAERLNDLKTTLELLQSNRIYLEASKSSLEANKTTLEALKAAIDSLTRTIDNFTDNNNRRSRPS